jgi:hypothetical protein
VTETAQGLQKSSKKKINSARFESTGNKNYPNAYSAVQTNGQTYRGERIRHLQLKPDTVIPSAKIKIALNAPLSTKNGPASAIGSTPFVASGSTRNCSNNNGLNTKNSFFRMMQGTASATGQPVTRNSRNG